MFGSIITTYRTDRPCITKGDTVRVYRNLHRNCYSVQKRRPGGGWRVVAYAETVLLKDAEFTVQPGGNARVRAEGKKNVHAYVQGQWLGSGWGHSYPQLDITYNPHQHTSFVRKDTGGSILFADLVYLHQQGACITPTIDDVGECDVCDRERFLDHVDIVAKEKPRDWWNYVEYVPRDGGPTRWLQPMSICACCIDSLRAKGKVVEVS